MRDRDTGAVFDRHLTLWGLVPDGPPIETWSSRLLPVRRGAEPAMLKIALAPEERFGAVLLDWWSGQGAARLLAHDETALLMERAEGAGSLSVMARDGRDGEATGILCDVIAVLHAPRGKPPPDGLVPLDLWFRDLWTMEASAGGFLTRAVAEARWLLADPRPPVPLHGDIHHDNVLDFGARGWLAIDPKRLWGEPAFDYANLFCNPDVGDASARVAVRREIFEARLTIVAARSGLAPRRLLQWIVAWTGLSAAWFLMDGESDAVDRTIAAFAIAALDG